MSRPAPWWKGPRGEWYVVAQGGLFALILFGPSSAPGLPAWPRVLAFPAQAVGAMLLALGVTICAAAVLRLGRNLTPLPHPRDDCHLVETGPYGWVRHPIYSGLILAAFGWALIAQGWLTLLWAVVLLVFFDIKSRREERWLMARFPAYASYRKRVRKLIPLIY
ncbi:isoprenylcysteine carboxylmethyltransferase family protein [Zoogloea sp.]|uniref:methyltransferase family protein n=1 Tax=Zoogloea sp. TaxID=49181 RepID=UPI0035AD80ED